MNASPTVALPRGRARATGSLRLTRRGRVVAATASALLVTALSLIGAVAARAISHPAGRAPGQRLVQVVVRPGQSLWSVAERTDPGADTRVVVQRIIDLNGLSGDLVQPGQQLRVPGS
jgi:hypothetical protein